MSELQIIEPEEKPIEGLRPTETPLLEMRNITKRYGWTCPVFVESV